MTGSALLAGGFGDPVHAAQRSFRAILDALSRPGSIHEIAADSDREGSLSPAAAACCLTLLDGETSIWLADNSRAARLADWLRFHTGVALTASPRHAAFALVTDATAMPALDAFDWGSDEEPERGATLIVETNGLHGRDGWVLQGPGIAATARLRVEGLRDSFVAERERVVAAFPRGIDIVFTCGRRLAALPRTTRIGA